MDLKLNPQQRLAAEDREHNLLVLAGAGFAAMLWLLPRLPGWFFAAGSALFCGVLPLLLLGIGAMKNRTEKVKKTG